MSIRYVVKNKDDVELSDDGTEIEVLFKTDNSGNYYVDIPVEFIVELIERRKMK